MKVRNKIWRKRNYNINKKKVELKEIIDKTWIVKIKIDYLIK